MSGSLIPNAKQQYFDANGKPLAGGKVYYYIPYTTTLKNTYQDAALSILNTNPIILDAAGECIAWGAGAYRQAVYDVNNNIIWDQYTYSLTSGANFIAQEEVQTATQGQTVFTLTSITYTPGITSLVVFVNGSKQLVNTNYTETSSSVVTFVSGLNAGDTVDFYASLPATSQSLNNALTVAYHPPFTNSVTTNVQTKLAQTVSVKDFGAVGDGVTDDTAAIQTALTFGGSILIPTGTYKITANLIIGDNTNVVFVTGASFIAGANNITFFKSTTHAYYSQIHNPHLVGNGYTGVIGFDLTDFRLNAGIFNAFMSVMEYGFIGRNGCFGTIISNPTTQGVKYPIVFVANNSGTEIFNPVFDNSVVAGGNGTGTGVTVQYGSGSNLGARIVGGYIQGFTLGVDDGAIGTVVEGTYFEGCTDVDITANTTARNAKYTNTEHWGTTGNACYRFRNTDAMVVQFPTMGSGARTQVFDIDATNSNCKGYIAQSNASFNYPIGVITGILLSGYTQSFTITDASGAGLSLTQNLTAYWSVSENTVTIVGDITYPTTANGSSAAISLPIAAKTGTSVNGCIGYTTFGSALIINGGNSAVNFYSLSGGSYTNASMSGKRVAFSITYIAN